MIAGFLIRFKAIKDLKGNYTQRMIIPKRIVKEGIYKYIRHPFYLGTIIYLFGFSLLLGGWKIAFLLLPYSIGFFLDRIDREEQMLINYFGGEYIQYMKSTKKLIPFVY